ncbi:RPM1-interacting protein 4 [Tanacetum coccineum]
MVVKILMLKTSSRMDGMDEDVLDIEAQENLITVKGPKTSQPSMVAELTSLHTSSRVVLNHGGKICNSFVNVKANYLSLVGRKWSESYVEGFFHPIMIKFFLIFSKINRSVEVYTAEFHRLSSRNDLSETESQQLTRYINGLSPQIHDKISLVPVYTLDDAYNLVIRAENQLARSSMLNKSVPSVDPSSQHPTKISSIDTGKQIVSTNTATTKITNPYARPVMGKCFKCGVQGHRSNDCKANGGKVNLTLRDDEIGNGGETNTSDEDVDAEIRPWAYNVNATHKGKENTYTFHHDGVKMVLMPLSDGYNTNVSSSAECLAKGTRSVEAKVKKK